MKEDNKKCIIAFLALFGYVAFGHFVFENCFNAFFIGSFFGAGIATYFVKKEKTKFRN